MINPYCRYTYYKKLPKGNLEIVIQAILQPCIRTSGQYETLDERERREFNESKKLWVSENNFNTIFKKNEGTDFIENYVSRDPSAPPNLHKFRVIAKNKWISGNFIV